MIGSRIGIYSALGQAESLLLDQYPSVIAVAQNKLRAAYSGDVENVRRDDNDAEQAIRFSGNDLNESDLTTFVGANNGLVADWFDQQGTNNFIQNTTTRQPQLVNSGTINKVNGKAIVNIGTGKVLETESVVSLGGASELWLFFVLNVTNSNSTQILYESSVQGGVNTGSFAILIGPPNQYRIYVRNAADDNFIQVNFPATTGQHILTLNFKGGQPSAADSISMWSDGVELTASTVRDGASPSTYSDYTHYLGARSGATLPFSGGYQLAALMTGDQSSNRTAIETIINDYYSIF